jgi:hypothetical protein
VRVRAGAPPAVHKAHNLERQSAEWISRLIEISTQFTARLQNSVYLSKRESLLPVVKMMEDEARHDPVEAAVLW